MDIKDAIDKFWVGLKFNVVNTVVFGVLSIVLGSTLMSEANIMSFIDGSNAGTLLIMVLAVFIGMTILQGHIVKWAAGDEKLLEL